MHVEHSGRGDMSVVTMLAIPGVVVAIGDEAVGPAVAHEDITIDDDKGVASSRRSLILASRSTVTGLCCVGSMVSSSLGGHTTTSFKIASGEMDLEVRKGLFGKGLLAPCQASVLVDTGLVEDDKDEADHGGICNGLKGECSEFLRSCNADPQVFKRIVHINDGRESGTVEFDGFGGDDAVRVSKMRQQFEWRDARKTEVRITEDFEETGLDGSDDLFAELLKNGRVEMMVSFALRKLSIVLSDHCPSDLSFKHWRGRARMDGRDVWEKLGPGNTGSSMGQIGGFGHYDTKVSVVSASTCREAGAGIGVDLTAQGADANNIGLTDYGCEHWMGEWNGSVGGDGGHDDDNEWLLASVAKTQVLYVLNCSDVDSCWRL